MVSLYKGKVDSNQQIEIKRFSFKELVDLIKGDFFKGVFLYLQSLVYGSDFYKKEKLEKNIYYFTPQSTSKNRKVIDGVSNILCFDLDVKDNKDLDLIKFKENLMSQPDILCFHRTTGGGLKIYIKRCLSKENFKLEYNSIREQKEEKWGVILDKAFNKLTQPCFLSWDPDLYYNEDSYLDETPIITKEEVRNTYLKNKKTDNLFTKNEDLKISNDEDEVLNVVFFNLKKYKSFSEGSYHLFCVAFAYICKQFGVLEKNVTNFIENKMNKKITSNCISYPYSDGGCGFGTHELSERTLVNLLKSESRNIEKNINKIEETKKILVIKDRLEEVYSNILPLVKTKSLFLVAPMGVGKTYFALKTLTKELDENIIFTLPRKVQVEQVKNEYLGCGAVICTWDVLKNQDLDNSVVVVDEAHLLSSDSEFRNVPLVLLENLKRAKRVIFLTATPDFNSEIFKNVFKDLEFLEVKKSQSKKVLNLNVFEKREFKKVLSNIIEVSKKEVFLGNKVVINFNSVKVLKMLEKEFINQNFSTTMVHSSQRVNHSYSESVLNNFINTDITLTTKVFEVGLNIYNKNITTIKIVNNLEDSAGFLQFNSRFRFGVVNSYLFLLKMKTDNIDKEVCKLLMDRRYRKTEDLLKLLREEQEFKKTIKHKEISSDFLTISNVGGELSVNILHLLNKYNRMTLSFDSYIEKLEDNYIITDFNLEDTEKDNNIKQLIKNEDKKIEEAKELVCNENINNIKENYNNLYFNNGLFEINENDIDNQEAVVDIAGEDIYLQRAIIEEVGFIKALTKRGIEDIDLLRKKYKKKNERKDILLKLDIFLTKDIPLEIIRSDYKKTQNVYKAIREIGRELKNKELTFDILMKRLEHFGIEDFTTRTVKSAFENIFEVKVKSKRFNGEVKKVIIIKEELNYNVKKTYN